MRGKREKANRNGRQILCVVCVQEREKGWTERERDRERERDGQRERERDKKRKDTDSEGEICQERYRKIEISINVAGKREKRS